VLQLAAETDSFSRALSPSLCFSLSLSLSSSLSLSRALFTKEAGGLKSKATPGTKEPTPGTKEPYKQAIEVSKEPYKRALQKSH